MKAVSLHIWGYFANSFSVQSNSKKAQLLCAHTQKTQVVFFFKVTWHDPFVRLHLFLHELWFTWAHLRRRSRLNVTQNTTRFKFCGSTHHTCPDKCKGSVLLHTRWVQGHFSSLWGPAELFFAWHYCCCCWCWEAISSRVLFLLFFLKVSDCGCVFTPIGQISLS